jgi:hypothetical protein
MLAYSRHQFVSVDIHQLKQLRIALELPERLQVNGTHTTGLECLAILCRRLAYPNRLLDLVPLFGRCETVIDDIFLYTLDHVYSRYKNLLEAKVERFTRIDRKCTCLLAPSTKKDARCLMSSFGSMAQKHLCVDPLTTNSHNLTAIIVGMDYLGLI